MGDDETTTGTGAPDPAQLDPAALKQAHERTGRMLKAAGLPFEQEELEGTEERASETSSADRVAQQQAGATDQETGGDEA